MLFCEGVEVQKRTVWTRTRPDPGLRAGSDQVELLSLMSKVQAPARSAVKTSVWVQSIVLALVLLGTLVSVDGILVEDQEELLVELHNRYRGLVQPSASAMLPLKWDGNLKLIAEGYAAKCEWKHNQELKDTGENLFAGNGPLNLEQAVEKWFLERQNYNYDNNSCDEDKMCGHYTQMVWADSHRVGCAVHLCAQMEGLAWTEPAHFLVCNYYPPGNYEGDRPYVEGEWCSQCPENLQRCENSLCAPEEEPTEAESIEEATEVEAAQEAVTTSSFQDLHMIETTPGPDPDLKETEELEAVVPPPATESIPPEPLTTANTDTEPETVPQSVPESEPESGPESGPESEPESVTESVPQSGPESGPETVPESVPETVPEMGSKTEPATRPEPEVVLQPKPETPKEEPTGGPAGGAVVLTDQELKIPPVAGKAPPPPPYVHQTPPPENRGQMQKDTVDKHRRDKPMRSDSGVLSGSWSLVFLWICLLCL